MKSTYIHFLHTVHCVIFNHFYGQHWNWYLLCLLEIHESLILKKIHRYLKKYLLVLSLVYYFFNNMINIEVFDSNLLKVDKKSYKNIDIYYI